MNNMQWRLFVRFMIAMLESIGHYVDSQRMETLLFDLRKERDYTESRV